MQTERNAPPVAERRYGTRSDPTFAWATGQHLAPWREALQSWTAQHRSRAIGVRVSNVLLDRVAVMQPTPSVDDYCRRTHVCAAPLHVSTQKGNNGIAFSQSVRNFFEWYLDTRLSKHDRQGTLVRSPNHRNPVPKTRRLPHPSETRRDALPLRLIRQLFAFLTADDWRWAKTIEADWISVRDAGTQENVRVWCPVRASVLALKLLLPLRTFQLRMLESGEGDAEHYVTGEWVPNRTRHAPSAKTARVRRGFLRAFRDRLTGNVFTGFFVNTNKTAKSIADQVEIGYEIPWQHDEAIKVVEQLERWQAQHNPIDQPLMWSSIHEEKVRLSAYARTDAAFFLMRDPRGDQPNAPITSARVLGLWEQLMAAFEDDLARRGERLPDGRPIRLTAMHQYKAHNRLTAKFKIKHVRRPLYDLHTLRVSLLTALAVEGGVPLHVLSKCIAGHASLTMTLYYVKTDPATVERTMRQAEANVRTGEVTAYANYLQSKTRSPDGYVADPMAIAELDGRSPVSWQMVETGICPVGGTRCSDGGARIGKNVFGPVPGGRNCVRCRFHVSGPAFLPGIVFKFNACSMRVERAREQLQAAQNLLIRVEDAQYNAEKVDNAGDPAALSRARDRFEEATAVLESESATLQETAALAERCKEILRKSDGASPNLILRSEKKVLDMEIRATSSFALWDAVCQASTLHADDVVPEARLRRNAAIDRMLVRSGRAPMMFHLPDDAGMALANELTRLMALQMGPDRAFETISDERATLEGEVALLVDETLSRLSQPLTLEKANGSDAQ